MDPIEDTMRTNRDRKQQPVSHCQSDTRQPLREIQRNIRLPLENKKRSMFRHPISADRLPSKFSSTATFDGFDEAERRLPTRVPKPKHSPSKGITFSGTLSLTNKLNIGPLQMNIVDEPEGIEKAICPAQLTCNSRSSKKVKRSDLTTRFKQLEVTFASNHHTIQTTEEVKAVRDQTRDEKSSLRVLNELATLTAPGRDEDSDDETTSVDDEANIDDQASIESEDHGSEPGEHQHEFGFENDVGPSQHNSRPLYRDLIRHSRRSRSTYAGTKRGVRDADAFAGYLNAEDREEYLSRPGQAARMKTDGRLIQVQDEIEDPSSSPPESFVGQNENGNNLMNTEHAPAARALVLGTDS